MGNLMVLAMQEPVRVDARRLAEIVDELGETAANDVICLALEQLAQALSDVRHAALTGDMAGLAARAEMLSRLAWQVGLVSLAAVEALAAEVARIDWNRYPDRAARDLRVKIAAPLPYSWALTISSASPRSLARMKARTGPKISS